jgi:NADPH:quinone reductase-like Zn-dependent oxidoreductase
MLTRLARGELQPVIAEVLPLEQIARAHAMLEAGDARGKVVLRVAGSTAEFG